MKLSKKSLVFLYLTSVTLTQPMSFTIISCGDERIDLAAFGDSLTYRSQYNEYVGEILNLKHTKNYGIPGSTISDVPDTPGPEGYKPFIYRYQEINRKAKIIAIDGGYNDRREGLWNLGSSSDADGKTFYGALNILFNGLKLNFPSSYIFFITPFFYDDERGTLLTPYVDAIRESCLRYKIDCMDIFTPTFDFDYEHDTYDGTHPTLEFTKQKWAPAIATFILEHYK